MQRSDIFHNTITSNEGHLYANDLWDAFNVPSVGQLLKLSTDKTPNDRLLA